MFHRHRAFRRAAAPPARALVALALLLAPPPAPCAAQEPAVAGGDGTTVEAAYLVHAISRLRNEELQGQCGREITADRMVIRGGVSAESLKPGQTDREIEREVAAIEAIVAPLGGTVHVHERLRAVRNPGPASPREPQPKPFVAVQRLEIELPAATAVDPLLDRLLVAGLDRFGRDIEPEAGGRAARPVAAYRFDALGRELDALLAACRSNAYDAWCGVAAGEQGVTATPEAERCRRALGALDPFIRLTRLHVYSDPVANGQGRVAPLQFSHPWQPRQVDAVEVLSAQPIRLSATASLRFQLPQP